MSNNQRRALTFKALKTERGWPYSRQHTQRLINAGRFPKPKKAPGGVLNIWFDDQIDEYYASIAEDSDNVA
jgi:predicted DNA-binding transcriptional regulator AlpA